MKKRNMELVESEITLGDDGFSGGLNIEIDNYGTISKRKGYNTFGEMVDVLWRINKKARKNGWSSNYTIKLPLKGIKPVYKKTLES